MSVIFIALVFAIFYRTTEFSFAALVAVVYLIKQIFQFLNQLQTLVSGVYTTTPFLYSLVKFSEEFHQNEELEAGSISFKFQKELVFENVSFSYESGKSVLRDFNLSIKKGEMIGIIGPSGGGKTTLVDLLLRLFYPQGGRIIVDGVSLDKIDLHSWRKNIGYVSQDIFLINDSIKNNISFFDQNIDIRRIEEVSKMAQIYDLVQSQAKGFEAEVGERGVLFSGGEKQRIAIARALARKPEILILDEATSALDNESERKIQEVIKSLKGKLTVIVIAHRISTIESADRIIALKNGKIEEEGRPDDLLKNKESYFYRVNNI